MSNDSEVEHLTIGSRIAVLRGVQYGSDTKTVFYKANRKHETTTLETCFNESACRLADYGEMTMHSS